MGGRSKNDSYDCRWKSLCSWGKGIGLCGCKIRKKIWSVDLVEDLGGRVPNWGYTESVLLDDGRVICTPGGDQGAIAALNAESGKVIWRSKEFTDAAQYSSPIVITNHGKKEYVQLVMKNLVGIEANTGKLSWKSPGLEELRLSPPPFMTMVMYSLLQDTVWAVN